MAGKIGAAFTVLVLLLVSGAMVTTAISLLRTGDLVLIGAAVGILLLVVVGVALTVGEVKLGADSARLAKRLEVEGGLPYDAADVQRLPSGRLEKVDADAAFALRKDEVEAAPEDWRAWWRLAAAYGEARDARRGRRAMRTAVSLERRSRV